MANSGLRTLCRGAAASCALLALAGLAACRPSAWDALEDARAGLADAAYDDAIAAADGGLAASPDPKAAWGLALVKLEAHARAGRGPDTLNQLHELARLQPERLPASLYAATADQLRTAGDGTTAIQVLDLGLRRHPDDPALTRLIAASQQGDVDPAELEMLRSLGYVE